MLEKKKISDRIAVPSTEYPSYWHFLSPHRLSPHRIHGTNTWTCFSHSCWSLFSDSIFKLVSVHAIARSRTSHLVLVCHHHASLYSLDPLSPSQPRLLAPSTRRKVCRVGRANATSLEKAPTSIAHLARAESFHHLITESHAPGSASHVAIRDKEESHDRTDVIRRARA